MMIPTGFYGDCSHYADMPKPDEIFDWERFTSPNWLLDKEIQDTSPVSNNIDEIETLDSNNSNLSFIL
jgi:hypothetical protein